MSGREGGGNAPAGDASWVVKFSSWTRQLVNRVVFQIDEEQEARMRAYLDETYGSEPADGRGNRPVQMGALRPPPRQARVAQPPTTHDEEVAQRLYETLEAANAAETPTRAGVQVRTLAGSPCLTGVLERATLLLANHAWAVLRACGARWAALSLAHALL